MQVFASKKVYMFFYGVIGIINVRPFRNKKMTLITYFQKHCCFASASKAYGRFTNMSLPKQKNTWFASGDAVHLSFNHVVDLGEEVWDQVEGNGEEITVVEE